MTSQLTAVSLFAGVGGIDLALKRAGVHVTAAVEIDDAARGVIADRLPETALFTDVTEVTADELRSTGFVPERGIVTAGFPCQDLSVAGRRRGMGEGTRSGLFWHIVRILVDLNPRWVLLENVPGILSATCPCPGDGACGTSCPLDGELHAVAGGVCEGGCIPTHGGTMGAVLGALGELGYGFAYRVLDAQFFGVPQRRRRVFFVGCLGDQWRPVEVLAEPEGGIGDSPQGHPPGQGVAATLTRGSSGSGVSAPGRRQEDDVNLVVSTLQGGGKRGYRVDAEAAAGGHLVTALTTRCGNTQDDQQTTQLIVAPTLTASMGSNAGHPGDAGKDDMVLSVMSATGETAHTLTSEGHDASEDGTGRGTPIIAFDPKAGGDRSSSGAFEDDTGITPTMQGARPSAISTQAVVRRLTPRECERLQGFPDDWTVTSNGKPQADSARYRQMGNAVAVPCVEWIAHRIRSFA